MISIIMEMENDHSKDVRAQRLIKAEHFVSLGLNISKVLDIEVLNVSKCNLGPSLQCAEWIYESSLLAQLLTNNQNNN